MSSTLPPPKIFDPADHPEDAAKAFKLFIRQWKLWYKAECMQQIKPNTPEATKAQHMANFFRASISINNRLLDDILHEFKGNEQDFENATFEIMVDKLTTRYEPSTNQVLTNFQFHLLHQKAGEPIDSFINRVKEHATRCTFKCTHANCTVTETLIRDRIVTGTTNKTIRDTALLKQYDLTQLEKQARKIEATELAAETMQLNLSDTTDHISINRIGKSGGKYSKKNNNRQQQQQEQQQRRNDRRQDTKSRSTNQPNKECNNCHNFNCSKDICPARLVRCQYCGIMGHYQKCCNKDPSNTNNGIPLNYVQAQAVHVPPNTSNFPAEYVPITHDYTRNHPEPPYSSVNFINNQLPPNQNNVVSNTNYLPEMYNQLDESKHIYAFHQSKPRTNEADITINDYMLKVMVDTGSEENIILQKYLPKQTIIKPTITSLLPFGSTPIEPLGEFMAMTRWGNKSLNVRWLVVGDDSLPGTVENILSGETAQKLGILEFRKVAKLQNDNNLIVQQLLQKYPSTFKGLGKLQAEPVHLYTKPEVKPVIQPPRPIPYHLQDKFAKAIDNLLNDDVIEVHKGPVTWISNPVLIPKPDGTLRICVDLRQVNKALENTHLPIPRIEDILPMFSNKQVFSKLDLKTAFHQLELDDQSKHLTVFRAQGRLLRFKRLTMGTLSASGELNYRLKPLLSRIPNADIIQDDIIIATDDYSQHYITLEAVLKVLQDAGLTLNLNKCIFASSEIPFWGMRVTSNGLQPDKEKVYALQIAGPPKDKDELNSFLCMVRSNADFIPNLATMTTNLRQLLIQNSKFKWDEIHTQEFNAIKNAFKESVLLHHYDTSKNTFVIVDAHITGLSAILAQGDTIQTAKAVALASRATTPTEQRYDQLSLEALAIDFGLRRFHHYLVGANKFTVVTDHKPLESIWKRTRPWQVPFRIERIQLRHQHLNYEVRWYPGKHNVADYISRHAISLDQLPKHILEEAQEHTKLVFMLHNTKYMHAISHSKIIQAQKEDSIIRKLHHYIRLNKQPNESCLKGYRNIFKELSISDGGLILRGEQIILPSTLHPEAIALAHQGGHPGQDSVIRRMRAHFWFPGLNDIVKHQLQDCQTCQAFTNSSIKAPLSSTSIPQRPWQDVSLDLFGPLPDSSHFLVARCNLSRFPEAKKVKSTSANHVLPALENIYNNYGNPICHKADNGPPFNSKAFKDFSTERDISIKHTPPYHPQSNEAECFMKPLGKTIKAAIHDKTNVSTAVNDLLQSYRSTPHKSTGVAPGQIMFRGGYRTGFPSVESNINLEAIRTKDMKHKQITNSKINTSVYRQYRATKQGDLVLVKNSMKRRKWDPIFDPKPYIIQKVINTCYELYRPSDGKCIFRHMNETKPYHGLVTCTKNPLKYYKEPSTATEVEPAVNTSTVTVPTLIENIVTKMPSIGLSLRKGEGDVVV